MRLCHSPEGVVVEAATTAEVVVQVEAQAEPVVEMGKMRLVRCL